MSSGSGAAGTPLSSLQYTFNTASAISSPAAETIVAGLGPVYPSVPAGQAQFQRPVRIEGYLNVTPGTGATALVVNIRQGAGLAGAVVGTCTLGCAAGVAAQPQITARDLAPLAQGPAGQFYTVSIAQTGASAAGSVTGYDMEVSQ